MACKSAETNMAIGLKAIGLPKIERISRCNEFGLKMGLSHVDLKNIRMNCWAECKAVSL